MKASLKYIRSDVCSIDQYSSRPDRVIKLASTRALQSSPSGLGSFFINTDFAEASAVLVFAEAGRAKLGVIKCTILIDKSINTKIFLSEIKCTMGAEQSIPPM